MTRPVATRGWELHRELTRLAAKYPELSPKALARAAGCLVATVHLHLKWKCACDPANVGQRLTDGQRKR